MNKKIIVIGGGAAGFFAAINVARLLPGCEVEILEKSAKLLSKVRISGGGRCNVTHQCTDIEQLISNYPRGSRELRQVFSRFGVADTIAWFKNEGVALKTEQDGRMFPVTDSSQTIIDCFLRLAREHHVAISTGREVFSIHKTEKGFELKTAQSQLRADYVICATGGHPKKGAYDLIANLGHTIVSPIPSLFTFNLPGEEIRKALQGVSVSRAVVQVKNSKLSYSGPLLITHWGLSGPAVLKLSAFAAELFYKAGYNSEIIVSWVDKPEPEVARELKTLQQEKKKALPRNTPAFGLPARLWEFLCVHAGLGEDTTWAETGNKQLNALAALLSRSVYQMSGKSTFKEEFVTAGGVELKEVDFRTMESRVVPGLYFCGEALNLDAITGGFNFQAAWSTAYVCALALAGQSQSSR